MNLFGESSPQKIAIILPAAGKGERLGAKVPKAEVEVLGKPLFMHCIDLFQKRKEVAQIILAVAPERLDSFKFMHGDKLSFLGVEVVEGGKKERWETIMKAGAALKDDITHVAVHDAARPLTSPEAIDRIFRMSTDYPCVIPGVPVAATVKKCIAVALPCDGSPQNSSGADDAAVTQSDPLDAILGSAGKEPGKADIDLYEVKDTIPRQDLYLIQTPQVLERGLFDKVYGMVKDGEIESAGITDDAGLVEATGDKVHLVIGDEMNIKITRPADLKLAELILKSRKPESKDDDLGPKRLFPTWADSEED